MKQCYRASFGKNAEFLLPPEVKRGVKAYITICFLGLLSLRCSSESSLDCLQRSGDTIIQEVTLPNFNKITVFEKVALVLKQGDVQKVDIETGANLLNEVTARVDDGRLLLSDSNDCNYVRAYGSTTIYVTSPNIEEIRSSTGRTIRSNGLLNYPQLTLLSESFINTETKTTDGKFDLNLNAESLSVVVNGIAYFKLSGSTESFNVTIAAGDSRIEAETLRAQSINLNHRGSNDLFVNPERSISGIIRSTGNVISFSQPENVSVEELYKGRLVFRE